jgi:hypothetical protein
MIFFVSLAASIEIESTNMQIKAILRNFLVTQKTLKSRFGWLGFKRFSARRRALLPLKSF